MSATDFSKNIVTRMRDRAHAAAHSSGRPVVRDHAAATLERRIESARRAARSRIVPRVPKT